MRRPMALVFCAVSSAGGAALVACFDLFHSTGPIATACELDASTLGCPLCTSDAADARRRAQHACAWLGACEGPLGRNAFGPCMMQATLGYDCAANPNHAFQGEVASFWACLAGVRSCVDVGRCLYGASPPACGGGDFVSCADAGLRVECNDGAAHVENCAGWGQSCAPDDNGAACAGSTTGACPDMGPGCYANGASPSDTVIHWCVDGGGDMGIECGGFGAQRCDGFPTHGGNRSSWVACVVGNQGKAGSDCEPSTAVTCDAGVASSCPTGVTETLDCAALLGTPSACNEGQLSPPFDWTSPCALSPAACTADSCNGDTVIGCVRGAPLSLDCAVEGLGPCRPVSTENGSASGAACAPP